MKPMKGTQGKELGIQFNDGGKKVTGDEGLEEMKTFKTKPGKK